MTAEPGDALAPVDHGKSDDRKIAKAVAALPALPSPDPHDPYNVQRLTYSWVRKRKGLTRRQYFEDLARYLAWWDRRHPPTVTALTARVADLDDYLTDLQARSAPATAARRLSVVSSWYRALVASGAAGANPCAGVERPAVERDASRTVGLTADEVRAVLEAADLEVRIRDASHAAAPTSARADRVLAALRDRALIRFLAELGLRVAEALNLDIGSIGHNRGYRTVRYTGKGGKQRERTLPPHTIEALDEYLAARAASAGVPVADLAGPLFVTAAGKRTDEPAAFRLVRRLAREGGVPSADRLSPHSLRHAFATNAREEGVPLEDVQDAMGHADPRTTRRYDRGRHALERDPALRLGALYGAPAAPSGRST